MSPTGRVSGSRPTIQATVMDQEARLSQNDIRLYFDGSEKTRFRYDPSSGRLTYRVGRPLSSGTHTVEIEAEVSSQESKIKHGGTARRRWSFTVAR
jgi:hypothetical protein